MTTKENHVQYVVVQNHNKQRDINMYDERTNLKLNNTIKKLETALSHVDMLDRIDKGHVQADADQVTDIITRLNKLLEDSKRFVELIR